METILITGIYGQDAYYLTKHILEINNGISSSALQIHGIYRPSSSHFPQTPIITLQQQLPNFIHLHEVDMLDFNAMYDLINTIKPTQIYNLAAQSHVGSSFQNPYLTNHINHISFRHIINACFTFNLTPKIYQASTSEMFGNSTPLDNGFNENSPFNPQSPYAKSKVSAHRYAQTHRNNLPIYCGILFNHESPYRPQRFVTRKITYYLSRIYLKLSNNQQITTSDVLQLGNTSAIRDWGFAGDYVKAMWSMLNNLSVEPQDFVIATNQAYSVADFLEFTLAYIKQLHTERYNSYPYSNLTEIDPENIINRMRQYIDINTPSECRPSDVNYLKGDYSKAQSLLNWQPTIFIQDLIKMMVNSDIELLGQ